MSLIPEIIQGIRDASTELTQSLRKSAYEQGWPAEAGRSLHVNYNGKDFDILMSDDAEVLEYGQMGRPPSAAVRKWSNDSRAIGSAIINAVSERLEKVL